MTSSKAAFSTLILKLFLPLFLSANHQHAFGAFFLSHYLSDFPAIFPPFSSAANA